MTAREVWIPLLYVLGGWLLGRAIGWLRILRIKRSLPRATRAELDAAPRADLTPVMRRDRAALALLTPMEALVLQQLSAGPCEIAAIAARLLPYGRIETSRVGGILPTMESAGLIEWLRLGDARRAGDGRALIAITTRGREALANRCPSMDEIHHADTVR